MTKFKEKNRHRLYVLTTTAKKETANLAKGATIARANDAFCPLTCRHDVLTVTSTVLLQA